jgi:nucleoside-diphosphate-sugar epimerase
VGGSEGSLRVLVTGGGGFLGGAIVRRLIARGDSVRSLARGDYPALRELGVKTIRGDIADADVVAHAAKGCDAVIHTAAKAEIWGSWRSFEATNVTGTTNIVSACHAQGVGLLVFTSSPSVVFNGRDMEGVDESVPYASHYETAYSSTKAKAERIALAANGPDLAVTVLRPHLIWGPGDTSLVPRIIARAREGRLRKFGNAPKLIDSTYIDDAADAHLLALDELAPGSPAAGRSYFISQGEPLPVWDLINRILAAAHLPPVTLSVPVWAAYSAAALSEAIYAALRIKAEPPMTRFVVRELATAHWFDLSAARRDLGYNPKVSIGEGLRRLEAWLHPDEEGSPSCSVPAIN